MSASQHGTPQQAPAGSLAGHRPGARRNRLDGPPVAVRARIKADADRVVAEFPLRRRQTGGMAADIDRRMQNARPARAAGHSGDDIARQAFFERDESIERHKCGESRSRSGTRAASSAPALRSKTGSRPTIRPMICAISVNVSACGPPILTTPRQPSRDRCQQHAHGVVEIQRRGRKPIPLRRQSDWSPGNDIVDQPADQPIVLARTVRAEEARHEHVEICRRISQREPLGRQFAESEVGLRLQRVVFAADRLVEGVIDGAGRAQDKLPYSGSPREIEQVRGARDIDIEHVERGFGKPAMKPRDRQVHDNIDRRLDRGRSPAPIAPIAARSNRRRYARGRGARPERGAGRASRTRIRAAPRQAMPAQ